MEANSQWSDEEVKALLAIFATESIQRGLEGTQCNVKIFADISSQLAKVGIHHSAKQCREKMKKMKQDYKKIKDQITTSQQFLLDFCLVVFGL